MRVLNLVGVLILLFSAKGLEAQEPDFSKVPGTVIDHSPAASGSFIGSPSLCILPDGTYIASHDAFGPKFDKPGNRSVSSIFESRDKGRTWNKIAEFEQFWSNLFYYKDALYFMGTSIKGAGGNVIIRRSLDGGHTWTNPTNESNGLLLPSGDDYSFHTSAVPVVVHKGRLWRAMETMPKKGPWGGFKAFMMSAPENSDLLQASSWTSTNRLEFDDSWPQGNEWLEGNAVITPEGTIANVMRVNNKTDDIAAVLNVSEDGRRISFNPQTGFITLPGAAKKFSIRWDPKTKKYWTLTNAIPDRFRGGNVERTRNTLYLLSSDDMRHWTRRSIILQGENVAKNGFQYVDWQFDGKDIVFVCRTAYEDGLGGADSQHNANFLTFHRIRKYKKK